MTRPLTLRERLNLAGPNVVNATSIPSPITGWNTRDALDAMEPTDAIQLDNWYPDAGGVTVRNGYEQYATGMGSGAVKTLAEYINGSTRDFLGAASGKIYDITTSTPVQLATGFASDAWIVKTFLGKQFWANGADTMQMYDGSTVAASTFSGITLSTIVGVEVYQQRLYFWVNNSATFYYAPLNSITGVLTAYDLSTFLPSGGMIVAVATMSHDGGSGVSDFIVFIMSSGDCLIFLGNDPGDIATWQMVGRYRISPPVSARSVAAYGGEAFLTTYDDHVPLHDQLVALMAGKLPPRSKVSNAVQDAVIANKSGFGWQALYYPRGRRLIFNIPNEDGTFDQHVLNTSSNAWCRFVDMNAQCWGLFNDMLYFGGAAGTVYLADTGNQDLAGPVMAYGQQAWNSLGSPYRKRVSATRPIIQSTGVISYSFGIGFDYAAINISVPSVTPTGGSPWDTSYWDVSYWSAETAVDVRWRIGGGTGVSIGLALSVSAIQSVSWLRSDFRMERGAFL